MLELEQLVKSRAHRILQELSSYRKASEVNDIPFYGRDIALQEGEKIIGVYENSPGEADDMIVVTTFGLHIFLGRKWKSISYKQLDYIKTPAVEIKHTVEELTVHLKSGQVIQIPIRGGEGQFRDAWSFLHFFNRVIGDVQKRS